MDSFLDVEYGPLPQHRLDIHVPKESGDGDGQLVKDAVIVFLHGGAWRAEDKADHAQLAHRLAIRTRIPVVVPNYRLSPREPSGATPVIHPAHALDALTALEFLVHCPPHQLNPRGGTVKNLYLIGHSCSAHMLASIFLDAPFRELVPSLALRHAVQSIALSEGIYDLDLICTSFPTYTYRSWFVEPAFGPPSPVEGYARFSVAKYPMREDCKHVRWFLVHSLADTLVDQKQTDAFHAHMMDILSHNLLRRDVGTINLEHNAMLRTNAYSDLMGDYILKLLGC